MDLISSLEKQSDDALDFGRRLVLEKIEIDNYRSIISEVIDVTKNGIVFKGENAVGKTTRIEAVLWCLTDRLFDGSTSGLSTYIRPNGCDGEIETQVELTFKLDGERFVLTKSYDGDKTKYHFNGVSVETKKDWKKRIERLFGIDKDNEKLKNIDLLDFFLNVNHIRTLDTKSLRELVLLASGDIAVGEIEMSTELKNIIKEVGSDDARKTIRKSIKEAEKTLSTTKGELAVYEKELGNVMSSEQLRETEERLKIVDDEIVDTKLQQAKGEQELLVDLNNQINNKQNELDSVNKIVNLEKEIEQLKGMGKTLMSQRKEAEKGEQMKCPLCQGTFDVPHEHVGKDIANLTATLKHYRDVILDKQTNSETLKGDLTHEISTENDFYIKLASQLTKEINTLKTNKKDLSVEYAVSQQKTKAGIATLEQERTTLSEKVSNHKHKIKFKGLHEKATESIKGLQMRLTTLESLLVELKLVEEQYLVAVEDVVKDAFGDDIKFKLFEQNTTNENITPICEMYVLDTQGRWVQLLNGLNTGNAIVSVVKFITIIKKKLGIRKSLVLVDFLETVGEENMEVLKALGEQVLGTQVVRGQHTIETEEL